MGGDLLLAVGTELCWLLRMLPGNGVLAENCGSSLDSLKDEVKNSVLGPYKKIIVH